MSLKYIHIICLNIVKVSSSMSKKISENKYLIGDEVYIPSFKKNGIIQKILNNNKYLISINSLSVNVDEDDIKERKEISKKSSKYSKKYSEKESQEKYKNSLSPLVIDLHGVKFSDLEEIVLNTISQAVVKGVKEVHLMHGIGNGILKNEIPNILSKVDAVKSFKESSNPGITIIYL